MVRCCSKDKQNAIINQDIESSRRRMGRELKFLLLGAGESGKSTIAKQMKIIHMNGFDEQERLNYKEIIYGNILTSIKTLLKHAQIFQIPFLPQNVELVEKMLDKDSDYWGSYNGQMTPQMALHIKALWNDPAVQRTYQRASEFQLHDSAPYYFGEIERLAQVNCIPTQQDVLRSRVKTSGIMELQFEVDKTLFSIVDVGGQRSERRKWIHCFQDVSAVLYTVALSGYDLKLIEDNNVNRMHESLQLFKGLCELEWFTDTAMILFLNKKDLFMEKVERVPLSVCFPEYNGPNTYDDAANYIKQKFLAQNVQNKTIYIHMTCATDTDNITVVFAAVKDLMLKKLLSSMGF